MSKYEGHMTAKWYVDEKDECAHGRSHIHVRSAGCTIADVHLFGGWGKANARLIADAPKLLAQRDRLLGALLKIARKLSPYMTHRSNPICEALKHSEYPCTCGLNSLEGEIKSAIAACEEDR